MVLEEQEQANRSFPPLYQAIVGSISALVVYWRHSLLKHSCRRTSSILQISFCIGSNHEHALATH